MAPLNSTGIDVTSTTSASTLPVTQIEPIGTATGYQPFSFDASELGGARVISDFSEATCSSNPATNPGNNSIDNASVLSQHNINGHHTISNEAVPPLPEFSSTITNGSMGYSNSPLSNSLGTASVPGNGQLQPHPPNQQTPLLNTNTLSMPSQMRPYNMMFGLPGMNCESRSFYDDHLALPPLPHNGGSWLRIRQPIDLVTPLKKPMNSFLLYSAERRVQLRQTHPDLNTTQQSTILAREWASLAEEEKEKYRAEAKQLRDDYNARRAELSLKLQQQLNQQHLGLGLAQPPQPQPPPLQLSLPPPLHGPAHTHPHQLDLLDPGAPPRDHLVHIHSASPFAFQQPFPGPMTQVPQTQLPAANIHNPHVQQSSGGGFQQARHSSGMHLHPQATPDSISGPFRLDSALSALNPIGIISGSMNAGDSRIHPHNLENSSNMPGNQDRETQAGVVGNEHYKQGGQHGMDTVDTFNKHLHNMDMRHIHPDPSKAARQAFQESDSHQMSKELFNTATGLFDNTFNSAIRPSNSGVGFGSFPNTEFKEINSAGTYASIVDFAATLPTLTDGSAVEHRYESGISAENERNSELAATARPFSFSHDQSVSSVLASSIAAAAGVVDYESLGLSAGTSGGRSSNIVRSGSVTKARARLSSPAKRTRKKGKKDPDAPKHPMSAFLYYLTSERPRLADQLGDMSIGQQTKIIAKQWKTLDENDKAPWERLAKHDKDRYARERREYHGETRQSTTPAAPN
ncbi:High mobility group [Coemansia sp. RSA 1939]|nr:High mobility group [Coemansia sp. RSA 1939]